MAVLRLHYSADRERWGEEAVKQLRDTYTSDARWRREMEVEYEALEGELLYPEFSRDRNLCQPFDVSDPEYWTLFMALDPHPRTAHAMVWEAFNKHGDRVVCGEFWPEFGTRYGPVDGVRWKTRDYAQAMQLFESDSEQKPSPFIWARGKRLKVFRRYMDTFGAAANSDEGEGEDYFDTYRRIGVELTKTAKEEGKATEEVNLHFNPALKGENNLAKAADSIGKMLAVRQTKSSRPAPPAMRVFEDCYETIDEFENVRYPKTKADDNRAEKKSDERVVTYQKHCLDCLHYIETGKPLFVMPRRRMPGAPMIYPELGY